MKAVDVSIIIGELENIIVSQAEKKKNVNQMSLLIKSARILSKVLEFCGDLMSHRLWARVKTCCHLTLNNENPIKRNKEYIKRETFFSIPA